MGSINEVYRFQIWTRQLVLPGPVESRWGSEDPAKVPANAIGENGASRVIQVVRKEEDVGRGMPKAYPFVDFGGGRLTYIVPRGRA